MKYIMGIPRREIRMYSHKPSIAFEVLDDAINEALIEAVGSKAGKGFFLGLLYVKGVMANIQTDRVEGSYRTATINRKRKK